MTAKLTDMQLVLLATACQRTDGSLLPPPPSLSDQGARIRKVVTALIKRTLAQEADVADPAATWREDGDRRIGVTITAAGRAVIAVEEASDEPPTIAEPDASIAELPAGEPAVSGRQDEEAPSDSAAPAHTGTKQALVLDMLRAGNGVSLAELAAATSWLPHTTRAALTGLRKKGHAIVTAKGEGGTRYRLTEVA